MDEQNQGLTLLEALERYSEPDAWQEYRKFEPFYLSSLFFIGGPPTFDELKADRAREIRGRLERKLLSKLQQGELVASAYVAPLRVDSERIKIRAEKWKLLVPKFDDSTAKGYGLELFDIRVAEPIVQSAQRGRKPDLLSQNQKIHAAFASLIAQGKVQFGRGGLAAAVANLAPQFPMYKPDSIRKIIHPTYKNLLSQRKSVSK